MRQPPPQVQDLLEPAQISSGAYEPGNEQVAPDSGDTEMSGVEASTDETEVREVMTADPDQDRRDSPDPGQGPSGISTSDTTGERNAPPNQLDKAAAD